MKLEGIMIIQTQIKLKFVQHPGQTLMRFDHPLRYNCDRNLFKIIKHYQKNNNPLLDETLYFS